MQATRWAGAAVTMVLLLGCAYGYRSVRIGGRYSAANRPDASYFCYDCHGYRYFDPYYDWCTNFGFRYDWNRYPRVVAVYRQRYLRIREANRDFGRYAYPDDYRSRTRYRMPRDYEAWKQEQRPQRDGPARPADRQHKTREQKRGEPGRNTDRPSGGDAPRGPGSSLGAAQGVET
jgi:hypothetical protein